MATSVPAVPDPGSKFIEFWKGKKKRFAIFTVNNYTTEEVEALRQYGDSAASYLVFGYEIAPSTGTPHLQAFVCWDNPRSILAFRDAFTKKDIHIETEFKPGSNHKCVADYCKKSDTKDPTKNPPFEEFGECPRQGARTDWSVALTQIKSGLSVEEVVDVQPQLLPCIRALDSYKARLLKPKHRDVEVIVLWGDSGSGKSRYAYENYPDLYSKPSGKWWDGYSGQTTILLDDYYGYIPYAELLNVLDRYPYRAEVKNGFVNAQWDTVIITSNKPPEHWYQYGLTPALKRRLTKIFFYSIDAPPSQIYPPPSPQDVSQEA